MTRSARGVTLAAASVPANAGRGVVYVPEHGPREDGTLVRVSGGYVMVNYQGQVKATRPDDLEWLTSGWIDGDEDEDDGGMGFSTY